VTFAKVLRACESGAFRQAFARERGEVPGTFSKTLCTGVAVK